MMLIFLFLGTVGETRKYNYVVRVISLTRKSLFSVWNWHHVNEKFSLPDVLKVKLMETFADQVLDTSGGKPGNAKRWIEFSDELDTMFAVYPHDNTITLWCDGKNANANTCGAAKSQTKRTNSVDEDPPVSKRAKKDQDIEEAFKILQENRSDEYNTPRLCLWARTYGNGLYDDLDKPPNVPAITGQPIKKKEAKYEPLTEALATTAIMKILVAGSYASPTRNVGSDTKKAVGISPASKANLSRQCLQQLTILQQLRENSLLSEEEFSERKHLLLHGLRGLNAS